MKPTGRENEGAARAGQKGGRRKAMRERERGEREGEKGRGEKWKVLPKQWGIPIHSKNA